jgi:spore germination protein
MRVRTLAVAAALFFTAATSHAYRVSVWVPPWNSGALTTVQANGGAIDESNPVWYSWNADGSIAKNWNAENATWRAAMNGSDLVPTIQNVVNKSFSASAVATMLASPTSREAHASSLASLAIQNAFDGIDVDYERVPTASRADFTAFITTLSTKLHAAGKTLSVTVYPKTSDSQNWNGPGSQDWAAIGRLADTVKIMGYDYHHSTSDAGTISPIDWLDKVVTYATSVIPGSKVYVGLPWYGYDWVGTTGATVSYDSAMQRAQTNGASVQRDADGEPNFAYADHKVFFQDATSYARKIAMLKAKHSSIGGVAHWAAGQEDPAIWPVIRGGSVSTPPDSGSSPVAPAPTDFTIEGPSTLNVTAGSSVTAAFDLVAINGFNATASATAASGSGAMQLSITPTATADRDATLRVIVPSSTQAGVYQVVVRFTSGATSREKMIALIVSEAPAARRRATHS